MITKDQIAHFDTFGFFVLRQAFSPEEMERMIGRYESMRESENPRIEDSTAGNEAAKSFDNLIEKDPELAKLAEDDRIYETIDQLLGQGFIWTGSEWVCGHDNVPWHADRQGSDELNYGTIKVHLYLDPTTKESCALRVIPGSHRSPFHQLLKPLYYWGNESNSNAYGVDPRSIPCYPFESNSGDVIFFNQCLFHSVFGNLENERRYIALKFGARIKSDADIAALMRYKPDGIIFRPHEAFINSNSARIRGMVEGLTKVEHG